MTVPRRPTMFIEELPMRIWLLIFLSILIKNPATLLENPDTFAADKIQRKQIIEDSNTTFNIEQTLQDEEPNSIDETGLTPLMQAAQDANLERVATLIEKGANVNTKNSYGWTALTYAVSKKQTSIVKTLLDRGADVNTKDSRGISALMWASFGGDNVIVKLLIERGADVNAEADNGATALSFATAKGHKDAAHLLKEAGGIGPQVDKASIPAWLGPIDQMPKLTNFPKPNVTDEAQKHGIHGIVYLRVLFGTDGKVKKVKVTSGLPFGLTEEAVKTALKLKAKPAMNNGQVVEYWVPVQIEFDVQNRRF